MICATGQEQLVIIHIFTSKGSQDPMLSCIHYPLSSSEKDADHTGMSVPIC